MREALGEVAAAVRRRVPAPLRAPALRRPAAARRDRDGVRLPPAGDRLRRADDRARRDDAGARARDDPRPLPRAQRRGAVRQPRSRGRRRARRPRRGDVRRADRRDRRRGGRCSSRRATPTRAGCCGRCPTSRAGGRWSGSRAARRCRAAGRRAASSSPAARSRATTAAQAFPPLSDLGDGHLVRCYHAAEAATEVARRGPGPGGRHGAGRHRARAVSGLDARYGGRQTLFDIELAVHRNECVALVGESGSGKTTLARCISGLHHDWSGEVRLGDVALAQSSRRRSGAARREIQYVFQNPYASLNPRRTVGQTIARQLQLFFPVNRSERRRAGRRVPRARVAVGRGRQPLPRPALRRRAPARRDRPRARGGAVAAGVRRGHVGARRVGPGRDRRPARRSCARRSASACCSSPTTWR